MNIYRRPASQCKAPVSLVHSLYMYLNPIQNFGLAMPLFLSSIIIPLIVWSIFWKGLALWHSARRGEEWWFLAMLFINTAGLLEIYYLFMVAKRKSGDLFSKK